MENYLAWQRIFSISSIAWLLQWQGWNQGFRVCSLLMLSPTHNSKARPLTLIFFPPATQCVHIFFYYLMIQIPGVGWGSYQIKSKLHCGYLSGVLSGNPTSTLSPCKLRRSTRSCLPYPLSVEWQHKPLPWYLRLKSPSILLNQNPDPYSPYSQLRWRPTECPTR